MDRDGRVVAAARTTGGSSVDIALADNWLVLRLIVSDFLDVLDCLPMDLLCAIWIRDFEETERRIFIGTGATAGGPATEVDRISFGGIIFD